MRHPIRWQSWLPFLIVFTLIIGAIDPGTNSVVAQTGPESTPPTESKPEHQPEQFPSAIATGGEEISSSETPDSEAIAVFTATPTKTTETIQTDETPTQSGGWPELTPVHEFATETPPASLDEIDTPTPIAETGTEISDPTVELGGERVAGSEEIVPAGAEQSRTFIAVFGSGPETLPGACWSYTVNEAGSPGATIIGPECDLDEDGRVTLSALPFGSFCFVVIPPPGFSRPDADYSFCAGNLGGGSDVTVGFLLTATVTPTPSPTRTPTPSPTVFSTPAPSEPHGQVLIQNCAIIRTYEDLTIPTGCQPVAGVTLAAVQRGVEIGRFTSGSDGIFDLELPERLPYTLLYISGNSAEWTLVDLEETRLRYNETTSFSFEPAPDVDQSWTITVRVVSGDFNTLGNPIGGSCARIERYQSGETLLAELCDDDGDGLIVFGELPPDENGVYRAHLLSIPEGYEENALPIMFGDEPASEEFIWTATFSLQRFRPSAVITTVNSSQQPVPGFCYFATLGNGSLASFRFCDESDGSNDGVTHVSPLAAGGGFLIHMTHLAPRWQATTKIKAITMAMTGDTPITFQVLRYGTDSTTKADLEVASVDQNGREVFTNSHICYHLWSTTGFFYGEHCADGQESKTVFEDLSIGSYELSLVFELTSPTCLPEIPDTIDINAGDIGKTVSTTVVFTCDYPPPPPAECEIGKSSFRHIDIYFGTAIDGGTGDELITTFEISESIPFGIAAAIQGNNPANDLFTYPKLAKWTEPTFANPGSGDWQTDARAALIAGFGDLGEVIHGEELLSKEWTLLFTEDFEFSENPAAIPECDAFPGAEFAIIRTSRYVTVRFFEIDAVVSERQSTPTPTITSTPEATTTPQPVVCSVPRVRTITLAFGSVRDEQNTVLDSDLQLSDNIPVELAAEIDAAIQNGTVNALIGNWIDDTSNIEAWIDALPQGKDAIGALQTTLSGPDVQLSEAVERETVEIELGKLITYLDEDDLPEGCIVAAWGLIYSVEQPLIARVRVIEINGTSSEIDSTAVAGSTSTPTVTPTPTTASTTPVGKTATATLGTLEPGGVRVNQLPVTGSGRGTSDFRLASLWVVLVLGGIVLTLFSRRHLGSEPDESSQPEKQQ